MYNIYVEEKRKKEKEKNSKKELEIKKYKERFNSKIKYLLKILSFYRDYSSSI